MTDICFWRKTDFDSDVWETECNMAFTVLDGTPIENGMNYCCFCGRELEESTIEIIEENKREENNE